MPTPLASDSFDRANENPLGAGVWSTSSGNVAMQIVSNVATPTDPTTNDDTSYYSGITWPSDHYSKAKLTVSSTAGSGQGVALIVRQDPAANTRYRLVVDHAASNNVVITKFLTGTPTNLPGWPVTQAWTDGDTWELRVTGSVLQVFLTPASTGIRAQVGLSTTDTGVPSGGSPGIGVSTSVTSASINDWEGGSVLSPFVAPATYRASRVGPYDAKGFLLSPYKQYDYTESASSGPAAISGTGAMLIAAFAIAGTCAQESDSVTASMDIGQPTFAGTSTQTESGTGSVAVQSPSFSGTVTQTITGTGAMAIPVFTFSGTSTQSESGTGSLGVPVPSFSGTSSQTESGNGSLAIASPAFSGTSSQTESGTGSLAIATPQFSGSGSSAAAGNTSGTGDLTLIAFSYSGTSSQSESGTGSLATPQPQFSGTSSQTESGSGSLAIPSPSIAGSGQWTQDASGGLSIGTPQLSGTGSFNTGVTGSGDMQVSLSMSGAGTVPEDTTERRVGGTTHNALRIAGAKAYEALRKSAAKVVAVVKPEPEKKKEAQKFVALHEGKASVSLSSLAMSGVGSVSVPEVAILDAVSVGSSEGDERVVPSRPLRAGVSLGKADEPLGIVERPDLPSDTPALAQIAPVAPEVVSEAVVVPIAPPTLPSASYAIASEHAVSTPAMFGIGHVAEPVLPVGRLYTAEDDALLIAALFMAMD